MIPATMETRLDPATRIGKVRLTVADLDRATAFYRDRLGMAAIGGERGVARLGPAGGAPLVELALRPGARRVPGTTGLYHVAILVPTRADLARAIRSLADLGQRFQGFSDHLVSEAAYLADPESNGIEIYRDRPRAEWPRDGDGYVMAVDPLDVEGLLAEAGAGRGGAGGGTGAGAAAPKATALPAGTANGHVHLRVSDLADAEAFYVGLVGFDVTARYDRSALFVSAGGYHHHVGLNTWQSRGAPAPPPDATGLDYAEIVVPSDAALERVTARIASAGVAVEPRDGGRFARDPAGNGLLFRAETKTPAS
ncbi:MAG: VOC family protein [Hyphomicrobiales bacterium]